MSTPEPLRLSIDVERGSRPVIGRVIAPDGAERSFAGWTELFAALEAAIADDHEEAPIAEAL